MGLVAISRDPNHSISKQGKACTARVAAQADEADASEVYSINTAESSCLLTECKLIHLIKPETQGIGALEAHDLIAIASSHSWLQIRALPTAVMHACLAWWLAQEPNCLEHAYHKSDVIS